MEALVWLPTQTPPLSASEKAHSIFPWQSPSSAADNTKILELSVCYLRCVHAPQDTEVLSFSLFYASAPWAVERRQTAWWESSLLTLSLFSCYIWILKCNWTGTMTKKKKKEYKSRKWDVAYFNCFSLLGQILPERFFSDIKHLGPTFSCSPWNSGGKLLDVGPQLNLENTERDFSFLHCKEKCYHVHILWSNTLLSCSNGGFQACFDNYHENPS